MLFILVTSMIIGLSLSLVGAGGSLVAIPALSYLLQYSPQQAVVGSLFLVLVVSLFNMLSPTNRRKIHWPALFTLGLPGLFAAYWGAGLSQYVADEFQLLAFALLALLASALMLRPIKPKNKMSLTLWALLPIGLLLGGLTGFIGVGAGFLMVPVLIFCLGLDFNKAVATSLLLISVQASTALIHYLQISQLDQFDWPILCLLALMAIIGSVCGQKLRPFVSQFRLTQAYSVSLILIASFTLWKNWPQPEFPMLKTSAQIVQQAKQQITEVDPLQAQQRSSQAILIDVREPAEFEGGHIPGAVNIPRGVLEMELEQMAPLTELATKSIYLYCRSGGRSALAALSLQGMGLTKVYSVAGGIQAWQQL